MHFFTWCIPHSIRKAVITIRSATVDVYPATSRILGWRDYNALKFSYEPTSIVKL
jgi:hypothetical protein